MIEDAAEGMFFTAVGSKAIGTVAPLPKGKALLGYWCEKVGVCAGTLLETLAAEYPKSVDRDDLAEVNGYSPNSGSFGSALAELRALGLVVGTRASDELMEAVRS